VRNAVYGFKFRIEILLGGNWIEADIRLIVIKV
jgi:hypothetical protein